MIVSLFFKRKSVLGVKESGCYVGYIYKDEERESVSKKKIKKNIYIYIWRERNR